MKGYQKKVIYLKNVGSPLFDEAYFVLKTQEEDNEKKKASLIEEANRIVEENIELRKTKKYGLNKRNILVFSFGFASAALIILLITWIF